MTEGGDGGGPAEARGRVWLVSYPKSGNTWFRFVLFHLVHGRMPDGSPELDAFCNSRLPPAPAEGFKKSHRTVEALASQLGPNDRVVYVLRHPLDVMQSAVSYLVLTGETPPDDADALRAAFLFSGGHPGWTDAHVGAGTWRQNVAGWRGTDRVPVHEVRYEDALADPVGSIAEVARFIGRGTNGVEQCVRATTFAALRAFEERELDAAAQLGRPQGRFSGVTRQAAAARGGRFFRKGQNGGFRGELTTEQRETARSVFGGPNGAFGYEL